MPQGPAARITDNVAHPLPPILQPGPGSFDTIIGFLPAWRGIPLASVAGLQTAKTASDVAIKTAEAATLAAAGTPGAPAAKLAEETLKAQQAAQMGSMITSMAGGADIHLCATPLPIPPHGPGVVIDGSPTVLINNLPACRLGDTILEAIGPPNKIVKGCFTVIIGQSGSGSGGGGGGGASGGAGTGSAVTPGTSSGPSLTPKEPPGFSRPPDGPEFTMTPMTTEYPGGEYPSSPSDPAGTALGNASDSGSPLISNPDDLHECRISDE